MKGPRTNYVKDKIKELKYNEENKKYVQFLISIEDYVMKKRKSTIQESHIKDNCYEEYKEILKELSFDEYKKLKKYDEENKDFHRMVKEEKRRKEKEHEKEFKKMWDRVKNERN